MRKIFILTLINVKRFLLRVLVAAPAHCVRLRCLPVMLWPGDLYVVCRLRCATAKGRFAPKVLSEEMVLQLSALVINFERRLLCHSNLL